MPCRLLAVLALFPFLAVAVADDWPQWQGIDRTDLSKEKGLLQAWDKDGPPVAWQVTGLGEGYTTPTVAAGRIFSMGNVDGQEWAMAFAEKDGKELWKTALGKVRSNGGGYPGPRSSPTVDGERVYVLGLNGDLLCLEAASGKEIWRHDLRKDFDGRPGGWGYSESVLIDGNKLICTPGGQKATLAALDKLTGEVLWRAKVPQGDSAAYSSCIVADVQGVRQYIQFLGRGVVGVAAADGQFLWRYDHPANGTANCSTPIYHDNHVFAASGYGTGGGLAKLTRDGDTWKAEEVYFTRKMVNHHGGMVLLGGHIYGSNEGQLTCLELKTGKVAWADGKPGKGSIAAADGRLYYRNERGPIVLVEINQEKYVERGRFTPAKTSGNPAWPHPVIANGKLYIRDQDMLFCYDIKAK
jgi:outer membrane protein assembly factor BamB